MRYMIRRVHLGDEDHLAHIQTESWKAAFKSILSEDLLQNLTQKDRSIAMYKRLLEEHIGNGYILEVDGDAHCIAWWDRAREEDMTDYAELICIHSLQNNWGKGYGTKMMDKVLHDMMDAGYTKVMLWVFIDNLRARKFYEARGFVTFGKTKPCFDTQEICYERDLPAQPL